jgi:SAM-dependent methyltransferase
VGASRWDSVARQPSPSWYLDPLVAAQKRQVHQDLVRRWTQGVQPGTVLKTDLFEEAHGEDRILFDLFPHPYTAIGMDVSLRTVLRSREHCPLPASHFLVTDARDLALRPGLADLIISNSTLDHFESAEEFRVAVQELARVLRPGGLLIITVDNPRNPLYRILRLLCRLRNSPFPLGYTTSAESLARCLQEAGLEVTATGGLIHNPRVISTLTFLALRRVLGGHADTPIRLLLRLFSLLERLPTSRFTACFIGARARKPCDPA